jgi:fragile X mental retardation protein
MDNVHKEFQKVIGAALCRYVPERGVLLAISRHEKIRRRSSMLQEMHFRNLSQKVITLIWPYSAKGITQYISVQLNSIQCH